MIVRRPIIALAAPSHRFLQFTCLLVCGMAASRAPAMTMETVLVGNPGNAQDFAYTSSGPFGRVDYAYRMGTYEVTNLQYATFLNAVGASDFNGLYHSLMTSDARGGIIRNGTPGSYGYEPKENMGNKPVFAINLWDAARFANWLHNGQPIGGQDTSTTEDGAYALNGLAPVDNPTWSRKAGATWFLPTENEWYKAAYYDPRPASAGGPPGDDHYWLYPTRSDTKPALATANEQGDVSNAGANVANYGAAAWNGLTTNLTSVGSAGPQSTSYYGTSDQGGNIYELTETPLPPLHYVARGGTYSSNASVLSAAARTGSYASVDQPSTGFRVASIANLGGDVVGDFDDDGLVTAADFESWRAVFGSNVVAGSGADGNGNGHVDAADYTIWRNEFGPGSGAIATTVPEPVALQLTAVGVVALACHSVRDVRRRVTIQPGLGR